MSLNFTQVFTRHFKMTAIFELSATRAARGALVHSNMLYSHACCLSLSLSILRYYAHLCLFRHLLNDSWANKSRDHDVLAGVALREVVRLASIICHQSVAYSMTSGDAGQLREHSDKAQADEERV
jgi:hypothetical protein